MYHKKFRDNNMNYIWIRDVMNMTVQIMDTDAEIGILK